MKNYKNAVYSVLALAPILGIMMLDAQRAGALTSYCFGCGFILWFFDIMENT